MRREYSDAELDELVRTVRAARTTPRGPSTARALFVIMAASLGVLLSGMALAAFLASSSFDITPFTTSALGLFIAAYALAVWLRRRFLRWVRSREYLVCPNCHYDLADEPSERNAAFCPECREPYRRAELPGVWRGFAPRMVWWD